jgi:predicted membrane-bound spermidine synthase
MNRNRIVAALLLIFTLSGFSGLIYESIWSHYLKLFLGHAAYAQVLVLAIFMGGMAIGAAAASRFTLRWGRVLVGYAVVEAVIGVTALLFHGAFDALMRFSFASVIPGLGSGAMVYAYKWGLASILILPQSILLGMTFPLMSAGLLRLAPDGAGRSLSLLYFTNSLGGAAGVLASGFVLVPNVGLPGAMMTAGLLNLLVVFSVWLVLRSVPPAAARVPAPVPPAGNVPAVAGGGGYRLLLVASLVTGTASFCYEIGWLRMLSSVLGSSTHAFELMLSSFILGLALGGLWIRTRIERSPDPYRLLGVIQIVMGLLALSTLYVYGHTFEWMSTVVRTFSPTESGYTAFNWASHAIASAVMLPTTFCAGMTLPLITWAAMRSPAGEKAIGATYAANTLGAILGIALSVHLFMPIGNAKGVIVAGAVLDVGLGLVLLWSAASAFRGRRVVVGTVASTIAFVWAIALVEIDPQQVVSGVFRHGASRSQDTVLYLRDGKTATVSLAQRQGVVALATNGKVDASINMGPGPATEDEQTQMLIGVLPVMLNPQAETAAVIGFGSGMSSHALLAYPPLDRVDTIEIEQRMVEAAYAGYYPRNRLAFDDPRAATYIEDAKTYFSAARRKYDIILSEPSNPWVSGVSSLFTQEFYRDITAYLEDGGVLAQWVQLYEIDVESVASIVRALSASFDDYGIYQLDDDNILVLARHRDKLGELDGSVFGHEALRGELERIGVMNIDDLQARWLGNRAVLDPFFLSTPVPVNSDYFPFIDSRAARARFLRNTALELTRFGGTGLPVTEALSGRWEQMQNLDPLSPLNPSERRLGQRVARQVMEGSDAADLAWMRQDVLFALLGAKNCGGTLRERWVAAWKNVGRYAARHVSDDERAAFLRRLVPEHCRGRLEESDRTWLALVQAMTFRDIPGIVEHADRLLLDPEAVSGSGDVLYLCGALMLAHLQRGEWSHALGMRAVLARTLPPDSILPPEIRLMEAYAVQAARRRQAGMN